MTAAADEREVMRRLRDLVWRPDSRCFLTGVAWALRQQLAATAGAKSTQASIPLDIYGPDLPEAIGSSWVFVLREEHDHPAERHPNSIQRMFALDSRGAMELWSEGGWRHWSLEPTAEDEGLSIPAYAWHRPARLDAVWGVVSFHTVAPNELVEEIGDPQTGETAASRHYLDG